jgi:hypothetical protein
VDFASQGLTPASPDTAREDVRDAGMGVLGLHVRAEPAVVR